MKRVYQECRVCGYHKGENPGKETIQEALFVAHNIVKSKIYILSKCSVCERINLVRHEEKDAPKIETVQDNLF